MDPAQCSVAYVYSVALWTVSLYDVSISIFSFVQASEVLMELESQWLVCLPDEWRALWSRKQFGAIEFGYVMARYYTLIVVGVSISVFGKTRDPGECGLWHVFLPLICDISTWACDFGRLPSVSPLVATADVCSLLQ